MSCPTLTSGADILICPLWFGGALWLLEDTLSYSHFLYVAQNPPEWVRDTHFGPSQSLSSWIAHLPT